MMNFLERLEEDALYEVLVATSNSDGKVNIRPFGLRYRDGDFIFNFFNNHSLSNIKRDGKLTVYFTCDALLFTRSLLEDLGVDDVLVDVCCTVECCVTSIESVPMQDSIGENITSKIIAKPVKIIEDNKTLPVINRATNHIIELLVDLSRYQHMNVDAKNKFHEKLRISEKIIHKTGNNKHKKAIEIIKKEIKQ